MLKKPNKIGPKNILRIFWRIGSIVTLLSYPGIRTLAQRQKAGVAGRLFLYFTP